MVSYVVKANKLHFHFHDPNTAEDTADCLLKLFITADKPKLDRIMMDSSKPPKEKQGVK